MLYMVVEHYKRGPGQLPPSMLTKAVGAAVRVSAAALASRAGGAAG